MHDAWPSSECMKHVDVDYVKTCLNDSGVLGQEIMAKNNFIWENFR